MYFEKFPKIYYDFPQDATSTNLQILTDITTNVRFRKAVLENITLYDEYDIQEGETPEIIAEKVYGNAELHWVIMLVNQRYNYLEDFPMTSAELYNHCVETYGQDNLEVIHHYEKNGIVVNPTAVLKVPADAITELKVHDFLIDNPRGSARIESIDIPSNTVTVMVTYGQFKPGALLNVRGFRNGIYTDVMNLIIPQVNNAFSITDNIDIIDNYTYETIINERKRRIKLISSSLIDQIIREFEDIVK